MRKKGFRRFVPWIVLALLALGLAALPVLARNAAEGTEATVLSAAAQTGEIENTLAGGGTLSAEDPEEIKIPSTLEITEFLVENGDRVEEGQGLAKIDRVTLLGAITEVQQSLEDIAFDMLSNQNSFAVAKLTSQVNGRIKAVYAQIGDEVRQVTLDHGAVAVVSVDGLMVTEVRTDLSVVPGEKLTVRLSDGTEVPGRAETAVDGTVRVTISDDGPRLGERVTVFTEDGKALGDGTLVVHMPWNLLGTDGTVNYVYVKENQKVWAGNGIVEIEKMTGSTSYQALASKHRKYEELMEELFRLYSDDTVKATGSGFVSGIDEKMIKNTAASDREYSIKLLADEDVDIPELENCWGVALVTSINPDGTVTGLVVTRDEVVSQLIAGKSLTEILEAGQEMTFSLTDEAVGMGIIILSQPPAPVEPSPPIPGGIPGMGGFDIGSLLGGLGGFGMSGGGFSIPSGAAGAEEDDGLYKLEKKTILSITPDDNMTVSISVDELDILQYEIGMDADVTVDALPDRSFTARVVEIGAMGENAGGNSKYTVKLRLDRAPDMLDGMNASVIVHRGSREALLVPAEAIHDRGSRSYVYTALDSKTGKPTMEVQVTTGISDGKMVEIVSGLTEGQTVFYEYYLPKMEDVTPERQPKMP